MTASEDKIIIDAFLNKEDVIRHERAVQLLFYGRPSAGTYIENRNVSAIKKAVWVCFSDYRYKGRFDDIYDTFVSLFYPYLLSKAEPLRNISITLAGWLHTTAMHFANDHRKEIDVLIGLSDSKEYDMSVDNLISKEMSSEEGDGSSNDALLDEPDSGSAWAENLVNSYIDQIPHENYRIALRALVLEGMPREELAEEFGISYSAVNLIVSRAMTALSAVALPDIRWRSKKNYFKYVDLIDDAADREILRCFFVDGIYDPGLPTAVKRLMKISRREMKEEDAN